LTDPAIYSSVKDMVARYEGLHIVAVGCGDADAALAEFQKSGAPVEAARALERDAPYGPDNKDTRRAKFRNMYVNRDAFPEGRFLFIEHLTRDVLWQPHLLDHPNGAIGIDAVYFVVADAAATARKFSPVFSDRVQQFPNGAKLTLDRGTMWLAEEKGWRERVPGSFVPPIPSPAGFGIKVKSIEATRDYFKSKGVQVHAGMNASQLWIAPEEACGAAIQFSQAEK
jgi:hypothetical protein